LTIYTKKIKPTTKIDHAVWDRFKESIAQRKGVRKGAIKESLEEALIMWCRGEQNDN